MDGIDHGWDGMGWEEMGRNGMDGINCHYTILLQGFVHIAAFHLKRLVSVDALC